MFTRSVVRALSWTVPAVLAGVVVASAVSMFAWAADHRDGPIFANSTRNGSFDINDIYVFQSPASSSNTVLVMTVSPFSGVLTPDVFEDSVFFDFKIDNNGDAKEDLTLRTTFDFPRFEDGVLMQDVTLQQVRGNSRRGRTLAKGLVGQDLPVRGGGTFRAANHDDPFFFDGPAFASFVDGQAFPRSPGEAKNFFGPNVNTLAIILEVPSETLTRRRGGSVIGVWARTVFNGQQLDRMGFPAINTALIPPIPRGPNNPIQPDTEERNDFNRNTKPRLDRTLFGPSVVRVLTDPGSPYAPIDWNTPDPRNGFDAAAISNFVLPDILPFDTASAAGFPNGRQLRDDVIDVELDLLTKGFVPSDNVADDNGTRITDGNNGTTAAFPYLGAPNSPATGPNP